MSIEPNLAARIGTKFFVYEPELEGRSSQYSEMIAAEMHIDYGQFLMGELVQNPEVT